MPTKQEVKQQYRELINDGRHKVDNLNYAIAVSSGLNVTQEIPDEAYKRAAWASNQGANFVEISIGGPSQIYTEWDNLLNISRQLGLSFDCHFPVQVPFDYSNPNRGQRQQMGFFYSHEFMYEFIEAWGEFKQALEAQEDLNGNQQHVYGINSHLVKGTIPERAERLAGDVSVDPMGERIDQSRMFTVPELRVGFFQDYMWEENLKDNFSLVQNIASEIEGFTDYNILFRDTIIDHMADNGYLDDGLLQTVSNLDDTGQLKDNLRWLLDNKPDAANMQSEYIQAYVQENETTTEMVQGRPQQVPTERGEEILEMLNNSDPTSVYHSLSSGEQDSVLDTYVDQLSRRIDMLRSSAVRNIAGVGTDVPETISDLKQHREGSSIAQNIPRFDPHLHENSSWVALIPKQLWTRDEDATLRDQEKFMDTMDEVTEIAKTKIKDAIVERLKVEDTYQGHRDYFRDVDREMSIGEVAFRDIINFRGGQFEDQLNRESVIYWYLMPYWMPFCGIKEVQQIWDDITKIKSSKYSMRNLDKFKEQLDELAESEHYDWIPSAVAGAYVWGHFTQFKGRGQDKTLVEMLDEYNLTLDWESHNVGPQGNGKLWKPHDIIKVCKAINNTTVNGKKREVMNCTIDMEHLAMNGVNPLWLIQGNDEKDLRGLDDGDGRLITKQHITHPALSEQQHHHQPIRRGDTVVYQHLHALVEKGFCRRKDRPCILMYELGAEKAESIFMLRLITNMIEAGIAPGDLEDANVDDAWDKYEENSDNLSVQEYMILKFYGLTDEEWHHEWQEVFEHALDPLSELLEMTPPDHTWSGRAALEHGENRPEDWQREEYQ